VAASKILLPRLKSKGYKLVDFPSEIAARGAVVSAFVVAFLIAASATGAPREPLRAKGIFADPKGGRAVYVFVDVHRCSAEPSLPAAQILESPDDGKTWELTGARLEGSEFQLAQASPEGVWVAGLHIAEGPGIDPFLLAPVVPADPREPWVLHPITSGPSELVKGRAGRAKESPRLDPTGRPRRRDPEGTTAHARRLLERRRRAQLERGS
jgi:hypothetical protein